MKIVIFGATGMVGQGTLRESLLAADVEQVLAVVRKPTGVRHPKLHEVLHADLGDLTAIAGQLTGYDACFYCLGSSSAGSNEADYTRINHDFPLAAAQLFTRVSPELTFVYVSGAGTNPNGRQMWQRVKGRTENEVLELLPHGYAVRPGFIQPTHGAVSGTTLYRVMYQITAPLYPALNRLFPKYVTNSHALGQAMLTVARTGHPRRILENADLR